MLHIRLVASRSAQEVLCQWLGVAQALAEGRKEEEGRGREEREMEVAEEGKSNKRGKRERTLDRL